MCRARFNWPQRYTTTPCGLGFCKLDQRLQAPVDCGLRNRGMAFEPELAQRQRRMSKTQLRGLSQPRRELVQTVLAPEPAQRLQLRVGSATPADEIRMVRVREPVRPGLRLPHHRPLVEPERGVARARERERLCDPIESFRIGDRVIPSFEHLEVDVFLGNGLGDELRCLSGLGPYL